MGDLLKIKTRVAYILENYPDTRNDDGSLWASYVRKFHGNLINNGTVLLEDVAWFLPKQSVIERFRRIFNRKYLYLPTNESVAISRRINMEIWKAEMLKQGTCYERKY